jgi:hypothetical protein
VVFCIHLNGNLSQVKRYKNNGNWCYLSSVDISLSFLNTWKLKKFFNKMRKNINKTNSEKNLRGAIELLQGGSV